MLDQGILFFCYLSDVTRTRKSWNQQSNCSHYLDEEHLPLLKHTANSGGLLQLEPATTVWESYCIKLVFSRSALQEQCIKNLTYHLHLYIHTFFVLLVTHFSFLLHVFSHFVALAGNYHTRPVSKSRLVALIFTLAIFHIWAWKSKFTPTNLKQCPAFEQQGRANRSRTY